LSVKDKVIEAAKLALAIGVVCLGMMILGIGCPIKYFTGVSCAGCGMTRAWLALLHFDIKSAFYYHPLFIVPFILLIVYILFEHKKFVNCVLIAAILFVILYLYRLLVTENDIVVFKPSEGLIYRTVSQLIQILGG